MIPTRSRPSRSLSELCFLGFNVFLIFVSLLTASALYYGYDRASSINRLSLDESLTEVADGAKGERVMNILLVGSDSSAALDPNDPIQVGRDGERFGDVIIIAHLDERTGDVALLSLPRDLWLPIPGTGRSSRINKAFEAGGPAMLIETIEDNFAIPINHYINVDFAGFQGLVSAVGSVDVYFETPARDWNTNAKPEPRSQTGFYMAEAGCQTLDAETALAYVRSRYYQTQDASGAWVTDPTSDLGRIRRQQDFLRRLMKKAINEGARNPLVLKDMVDAGLANVTIDHELTPQLIMDIASTYQGFEPDSLQTYSFPTVDAKVGDRLVLQPTLESAQPILNLFAGAGFSDPSTTNVKVLATSSDAAAAQELAKTLTVNGFPVATDETKKSIAETVVQYGPDGVAAAQIVASSLQQPYVLQQVSSLSGRDVTIRLHVSKSETLAPASPQKKAEASTTSVRSQLASSETSKKPANVALSGGDPTSPASSLAEFPPSGPSKHDPAACI